MKFRIVVAGGSLQDASCPESLAAETFGVSPLHRICSGSCAASLWSRTFVPSPQVRAGAFRLFLPGLRVGSRLLYTSSFVLEAIGDARVQPLAVPDSGSCLRFELSPYQTGPALC